MIHRSGRAGLVLAALALTVVAGSASARPSYVGAVPNVNNNCGVCHVAAGGGGPRNAFGEDVEAAMPFTGPDTDTWSALFCVDSDGDGKTNGQELGDPCGAWRIADDDPAGDISAPGDDSSTTADVGECDGEAPPTCDLDPDAGGGGCSATTGASSVALGALLLGAMAFVGRRRR